MHAVVMDVDNSDKRQVRDVHMPQLVAYLHTVVTVRPVGIDRAGCAWVTPRLHDARAHATAAHAAGASAAVLVLSDLQFPDLQHKQNAAFFYTVKRVE